MQAQAAARLERLDALRGLAMVWMSAYHLCFDLNHFGYIAQDFYRDPLWTTQRTLIVSAFLLCAGAGQAVAIAQQQSARQFARRWLQIAACAALVSLGSWWMFPASFICFGVLHGMAVMLLLLRWAGKRWPGHDGLWWLAGAAAMALPWWAPALMAAHPDLRLLDERWLNWIGLVSRKPVTEDYVPLLPWLGVMIWGHVGMRTLLRRPPAWLHRPLPTPGRPLAALGRWSLSYYMLHQPVLLGILLAWRALLGP